MNDNNLLPAIAPAEALARLDSLLAKAAERTEIDLQARGITGAAADRERAFWASKRADARAMALPYIERGEVAGLTIEHVDADRRRRAEVVLSRIKTLLDHKGPPQ